jgi:hypothetical protein
MVGEIVTAGTISTNERYSARSSEIVVRVASDAQGELL